MSSATLSLEMDALINPDLLTQRDYKVYKIIAKTLQIFLIEL